MQNFGAQIWTEFIFPKLTCEEQICEKLCCARRFWTVPNWRMPFLYPPKPRELIFPQLTCASWISLTARLKTQSFRTREFPERRCMRSICEMPNCFERTCRVRTCETQDSSTLCCHLQIWHKRICPRPDLQMTAQRARVLCLACPYATGPFEH